MRRAYYYSKQGQYIFLSKNLKQKEENDVIVRKLHSITLPFMVIPLSTYITFGLWIVIISHSHYRAQTSEYEEKNRSFRELN